VALDPATDLAVIKIDNSKNETFKVLNLIEDESYVKI
jgi:S1-C subfamily serine protease